MTQGHRIGRKCIPRRRSFRYSPIATTQTNTLVWVLTPREGLNEGFWGVLPCPTAPVWQSQLPNLPHSTSSVREVGK